MILFVFIIASYGSVVRKGEYSPSLKSEDEEFFEMYLVLDSKLTIEKAHGITEEVEVEILAAYPYSEVLIRLLPDKI